MTRGQAQYLFDEDSQKHLDCVNNVPHAVRAAGGLCIADEVQTGFGRIGTQLEPKVHLWLRDETKPFERRTALTPTYAGKLIDAGFAVSVERSSVRCFPDEEYSAIGATLSPKGSWVNAPRRCIILGIKELLEEDTPLIHQHIFFAHAYKGQTGWEKSLSRFKRGGGVLLDLTAIDHLPSLLPRESSQSAKEQDRVVLYVNLTAKKDAKNIFDQSFFIDDSGTGRETSMARLVSWPAAFSIEALADGRTKPGVSGAPHDPSEINVWMNNFKSSGIEIHN